MMEAPLALGWFTPTATFGPRVDELIGKIHEIVGPSSEAFPFAVSPLEQDKAHVLSYGVVRGHVPIHCDPLNGNQRFQAMWTFVLEAVNRPVLLAHPADQRAAQIVLIPRNGHKANQAFMGIELEAGTAAHFDVTKTFHGISGYPTGDPIPELPGMTIVQLPCVDGRDINFALKEAKRIMLLDERVAEFIRP